MKMNPMNVVDTVATITQLMYNHAPPGYICPFCFVAQGVQNEHVYTKPTDGRSNPRHCEGSCGR